ncbi:LabA-like NYN domain-containing protein [Vibrio sp. 10N]|uniref:LabA-like NYN domain-containing protein n=1 Tax=Vibrio sp. 10N TaxID=3058938 RepID=UPI002812D2AA|nr:NYN domain-containing protein [Vibrio sp. 10N]
MNSAAIFVDVQNVYYTTRQAFGARFDYNAFWAWASAQFNIDSARAYAIASHDPKQRQFHHILRGIGFDVQLKPFIQRSDGSAKGDWDVGIALDVFEMAKDVDNVILLSGDGDFEILVDRIQQRFGTRVTVIGVAELTANHLIDAADEFVPIETPFLLGAR